MTSTLGASDLTAANGASSALRSRKASWRDPRLWIGLALVAISVVVGARLLSNADDTIGVWAVSADLGPGSELDPAGLVVRRVRFVDGVDVERYLATTDELPVDLTINRAVGAGELLPRAALGSSAQLVQLPLVLDAQRIPPGVGPGSRVDIWVSEDEKPRSRPVLQDVGVISAPTEAADFGLAGEQQVVVGVPVEDESSIADMLAAAERGAVTVVSRG